MRPTQPILGADPKLFDPLGVQSRIYQNTLAVLPRELRDKLRDASFGIYNASPPSTEPLITPVDELKRQLQSGELIAVDEAGEVLTPPAWTPPTTVEGEDAFYAVLLEFGGGQTVLIPVDLRSPMFQRLIWRPNDEHVAFACLHIK